MRRDSKTTAGAKRIILRACPRCHGDLFPDDYEEELACLQCGRHFDMAAVAEQKTLALAA